MITNVKQLPVSAAIKGTKVRCSVLQAPLSAYFNEACISHLGHIFASTSAFLDWTIPDSRSIVVGDSQAVNSTCWPPTSVLLGIRPNINQDSILFGPGHRVTREELVEMFKYLTCELGWVGMDLRPGEQATERNGATALFNDALGPDAIRLDKIIDWALQERSRANCLAAERGCPQNAALLLEDRFRDHRENVKEALESGTYRRDGHAMSCTGPVTPEDFAALAANEFFHKRPATPLPAPMLKTVTQAPGFKLGPLVAQGQNLPQVGHCIHQGGAIQAPHMVSPNGPVFPGVGVWTMDPTAQQIAASLQRRKVGLLLHGQPGCGGGATEGPFADNQPGNVSAEELTGHGLDSATCSTDKQAGNVPPWNVFRGTPARRVVGEVMVFESVSEFNNHIEGMSQKKFSAQLRAPETREHLDRCLDRLRFVFIEEEGFVACHLYTLMPLFSEKKGYRPHQLLKTLAQLNEDVGAGRVVETNDIGNARSGLFDMTLLLRWAELEGRGISPNNASRVRDIAARMEDLTTVMSNPGDVVTYWSSEHCKCLQYMETCGCDEGVRPAVLDPENYPQDRSVMDAIGNRSDWIDEYVRHAKGRLFEAANDIKAELNTALERARTRMDREINDVLDGLHKVIDPEGHSKLYPSTEHDENYGHEEG